MSNEAVVPEAPEPRYWNIDVEYELETTQYEGVNSFKIEGPLLMMDVGKCTTVVPIANDVVSIDITPIYLEEV
jgi:hypothetical protein